MTTQGKVDDFRVVDLRIQPTAIIWRAHVHKVMEKEIEKCSQ